ncbi:MAG: hypothetical protein E3J72_03270 [Planctomycetota bacterium]|nr:MAG: hypothetical protein E3J72_03270 [Planctomycetota bacterium]
MAEPDSKADSESRRDEIVISVTGKTKRRFRARRRKVFPRTANGIYGTMIGEPPRPLPWWGPFDFGDTIGRAFLLAGFLCLACSLWYAADFWETGSMTFNTAIELGRGHGITVKYAVVVLFFLEAFLLSVGFGLLFRRQWAVMYFRLVVFAVSIAILLLAVKSFHDAVRWGEPRKTYSDLFGYLSPIGLVARTGFYSLLLSSVSLPLFLCWSAPHLRYHFSHVRYDEVERDRWKTTRNFGTSVAVFGCAVLLLGLIIGLFGFLSTMSVRGWGPFGENRIIHAFSKIEVLKLCVLVAAMACAVFIRWKDFRVWVFSLGVALVIGLLIYIRIIWRYEILRAEGGSSFGYPGFVEYYKSSDTGSVIVLLGLVIMLAGAGFRRKSNKARITLAALVLLLMPLCFAGSIVEFVREVGAGIRYSYNIEFSDVVRMALPLFALLIPTYILFEVWRYLLSDKARAWCGVGEYTPPWKYQVEEIKRKESMKDEV